MIQEVGRGGVPYDARRSVYMQTCIDYIDYITCCILQHFLAKLDASKGDDSNRGAIRAL